jgi:hypothetical protein
MIRNRIVYEFGRVMSRGRLHTGIGLLSKNGSKDNYGNLQCYCVPAPDRRRTWHPHLVVTRVDCYFPRWPPCQLQTPPRRSCLCLLKCWCNWRTEGGRAGRDIPWNRLFRCILMNQRSLNKTKQNISRRKYENGPRCWQRPSSGHQGLQSLPGSHSASRTIHFFHPWD